MSNINLSLTTKESIGSSQMLGRKRYSPNEKNHEQEMMGSSYQGDLKKEEGELVGNMSHNMMRENMSSRKDKYSGRPNKSKRNYIDKEQDRYQSKNEKYDDYLKRGSNNYVSSKKGRDMRDSYEQNYENEEMGRNYGRKRRSSGRYGNYEEEYKPSEEDFRKDNRNKGYMRENPQRREVDSRKRPMGDRYERSLSYSEEEVESRRNFRDSDYKEREFREFKDYKDFKDTKEYKEYKEYDDNRQSRTEPPLLKKKFNFLMVLPKNYFRFLDHEFDYIYKEIKSRIRDLNVFQIDYKISSFQDFLLRIEAPKVSDKAFALKMVCDFLFDCMKQTYQNMSYLKVTILVPSHVVGFIIGIEGKNINSIRDLSGARIDVFQQDVAHKYRQIELQGTPDCISKAAEKIYKIVNKYYFFNSQSSQESENSRRRENEEEEGSPVKRKGLRLGAKPSRKRDYSRSKSRSVNKDYEKRKGRMETRNKINNKNASRSRSKSKSAKKHEVEKENESLIIPVKTDSINNIKEDINNMLTQVKTSHQSTAVNSAIPISTLPLTLPFTTLNESLLVSEDQKFPLSIIITNQHLNLLKNIKGNIFIEIENKYHCSISKKVEKLSNTDVNILTLSGTPLQNCMAIYSLQQAMVGITDIFKN